MNIIEALTRRHRLKKGMAVSIEQERRWKLKKNKNIDRANRSFLKYEGE